MPLDADSEAALDLMREWDYRMDRDLAQPLIYAKTRAHLVRRIVEHLLGDFASEVLSEAAGSATVLRQIVEQMTLGIERGDTSITPDGGGLGGRCWLRVLADAVAGAQGFARGGYVSMAVGAAAPHGAASPVIGGISGSGGTLGPALGGDPRRRGYAACGRLRAAGRVCRHEYVGEPVYP